MLWAFGRRVFDQGQTVSPAPAQRQVTLSRSIDLPSRAPAPPPSRVPNVFEPPGAIVLPSRPPAIPPMIRPVVPSARRQ